MLFQLTLGPIALPRIFAAPLPDPSLCLWSVQEYLWEASHYLVKQVFNGIKEMFSATRDIQVRCLFLLISLCLFFFPGPPVHRPGDAPWGEMVLLGPGNDRILLSQPRGVGLCLLQGQTPQ